MALSRRSIIAILVASPVGRLVAQVPETFTNLQVLPKDIRRDSLVNLMRGFSLSLNVRCQYCHVGGDGNSGKGIEFSKDDDVHKRRARFMIRMVDSLNRAVLPNLPERSDRPIRVECKTCHRGAALPFTLTQYLERIRDSVGIDSAVARYRALRSTEALTGRFDFGEWETNLWAEHLAAIGRPTDAIAVYQLNLEFFPESGSIARSLGRLFEPTDRARAISYYERALVKEPDGSPLRKRVDSLRALPAH